VQQLLQHVAQTDLERCRSSYADQLAKSLDDLGQTKRDHLLQLLSDEFIDKLHESNPSLVEDIVATNEPGVLVNSSMPLVLHFIKNNFGEKTFNPRKKSHLRKGAKIFARPLAEGCPKFYKNSLEAVEQLRALVSVSALTDPTRVTSSSRDFRNNVLRFKYCEDILRVKNSPKYIRKIRKALKAHYPELLDSTKQKRSAALIIGLAFLCTFGLFLLYQMAWSIKVAYFD